MTCAEIQAIEGTTMTQQSQVCSSVQTIITRVLRNIYLYCVKMYQYDWLNKKLNGHWLARRDRQNFPGGKGRGGGGI